MQCTSVLGIMLEGQEINFLNKADTYCLSSKNFHWFNSTEKVHLSQIESYQNVNSFP